MSVWAIVPVKPLNRGKSRLAEVLTREERTQLNLRLLEHTLDVITSVPSIEQVMVISRDQSALTFAREHGARTILENGTPQLNVALTRATHVAKEYAVKGILIIPADLPLIERNEVNIMIEHAKMPPIVAIAPDQHFTGTNALLVCPPGLINYEFGRNSFNRHCSAAIEKGVPLEICELQSFALDIDLPQDLELLKESLDGFLMKT